MEHPYRRPSDLLCDLTIRICPHSTARLPSAREFVGQMNATRNWHQGGKHPRMRCGESPNSEAAQGMPDQIDAALVAVEFLNRLLKGLHHHRLHCRLMPYVRQRTLRKHNHNRDGWCYFAQH